jgi:signal transduction histidine kinase/ActR/RegA family two-component response regulator
MEIQSSQTVVESGPILAAMFAEPIPLAMACATLDDAMFDAAYDDFPLPVWLADPDSTRVLRANRAMGAEFGFAIAEIVQTEESQFCDPPEIEKLLMLYSSAPSPSWLSYNRDQRLKDGSYTHIKVQFCAVVYQGQGARLCIAHNAEARRGADSSLRQQIDILKSLVANAGYGLGRYCLTRKRLVFFNQHLFDMLRTSDPANTRDLPTIDEQATDYIEEAFSQTEDWAAFLEAANAHHPFNKVVLWRGATGFRQHVRLQCVPTETPYGVAVDLSVENATESVKVEQQARQSQKMEALGRMAGGVAHDFNNLLLVIRGHAELLEESLPEGSELRRHTSKLITASRQAADITSTLLTFSRTDEFPIGPLALNKTIHAYSNLMPSFLRSGVVLDMSLANEEFHVIASAVHIEQVVLNLSVNARDAMPDGGRLTVKTSFVPGDAPEDKGWVLLEVSDTGIGMDAETRAHIFEPFYTTKTRGKGTGLGLALVYGIVSQYGGRIDVDTEPGRGTSFRIFFPLVSRSEGEVQAPQPDWMKGRTVLLVDDEPEIRNMVSDFLRTLGHEVLCAGDASQAVEHSRAHAGKIDLLITDVVMPQMDGFELALKLREERKDLPVLVMSGFTGGALRKRGRQLGEVPFLSKPFSLRQLESSLKAILQQVGGAPTTGAWPAATPA